MKVKAEAQVQRGHNPHSAFTSISTYLIMPAGSVVDDNYGSHT